jgi:carboxy-terminal domain RNA polymerase II polypeptide A small phosphatase
MTGTDDRILIILDLDETLIYATKDPKDESWNLELGQYKIYNRPGLKEFLEKISSNFRVAVWSSASDDYVKLVVEKIFPKEYKLEFVWGRSMCTLQHDNEHLEDLGYFDYYSHLNYSKILKKIKKRGLGSLERTIIIDDTPRKSKYNYGNAIYPSEFKGDQSDDELELLAKYLLTLKNVGNVRTIEKRGWQKKVTLLILFCLVFLNNLQAQSGLKLTIVEKSNKTPVYRAHVFTSDTNGTVSNIDGRCNLFASIDYDSIHVTCIGYEKVNVHKDAIKDTIFLELDEIILNDIVVRPFSPKDTIIKAFQLVDINYRQNTQQTAFYRNVLFVNDTLEKMLEAELIFGFNAKNRLEIKMNKLLKFMDSTNDSRINTSPYNVIPKSKVDKYPFFNTNHYEYAYHGFLKNNAAYEIEFSRNSNAPIEIAPYKGLIYIDSETLAFTKLELQYDDLYLKQIDMHHEFSKNDFVDISTQLSKLIISFTKQNGKYVLNNLSLIGQDRRDYSISDAIETCFHYSEIMITSQSEYVPLNKKEVLNEKWNIYKIPTGKFNNQETFIPNQMLLPTQVNKLSTFFQ